MRNLCPSRKHCMPLLFGKILNLFEAGNEMKKYKLLNAKYLAKGARNECWKNLT